MKPFPNENEIVHSSPADFSLTQNEIDALNAAFD